MQIEANSLPQVREAVGIRELITLFCFLRVPVGSPLGISFRFHPPGSASVPGAGKGHPSFPRAVCKQSSAEPSLSVILCMCMST